METMTECLPPISDHPDLTGQARTKRRDSLGVGSWTVRGRTVCPTPGALLRLGSGPSSRTSKTRRTAPQSKSDQRKSKLGDDQSKKKRAHCHRTETFHPGNPALTDRQSRFDAMEDGGAGEFSGVVRSRCRRWWGWSGQFSPFCVHHHHHKHSSQLIGIQDMDIESGHELSNSL